MQGLSSKEVEIRKKTKKSNKIIEDFSIPLFFIFFQNIFDLPNFVVYICVAFLIAYRQYQDALMISIIITFNVAISVYQEIHARNKLRELRLLKQSKVKVIRDSKELEIDPAEIVVDDLIVLTSGQYIYVDGVLMENQHLLIDESNLTGESDYIRKKVDDKIVSGTFVTGGRGIYKVTLVGMDSTLNKITKKAKQYTNNLSPLQRSIRNLTKLLLVLTVLVLILLFFKDFSAKSRLMGQIDLLIAITSVVTSMVPQGILMTVTVALTLAAVRMVHKNVLVQKLSSIDTLAEIQVLCMDKTGTLTENQLDLVFRKNLSKESTMRFNSLIAFYCQSTLEKNKTIKALEKQFRDSGAELNDSVIADEMPFNSAIKQSGLEINNAGKHIRLILGGCESLYPRLENSADTKSIKELNESQASLGYRNLLLIYKESQAEKFDSALGDENDKSYKPLGFFSLEDKMRSNAEEIIASFIKSGVRPVVISGDNQHTLLSLIDKLHIKELQKVISCEQLKTQEEIDDAVIHYNVFARVTPQQKLQIIKTLKNQHRYVGMIGDGVNDALAIKEANIGIALGSGADATKSIADIILLDDKLINLNEIIQEGRRVLYNSRRGLQLILTKNFYAMILIVMTLFLGLPFPFHTRGLFILSLFIASLSSLFILLDRGKAPREVFGVKLYSFVITSAISIGVIGLVILIFSRNIVHLKTLLLTFLILTGQINYLFSLNKENVSLKKIFNFRAKKSWLVIFWIVAYLIFMYVPAIANTFTLKPLTLAHWLFILSAVFAYVVVFEIAYPPLVKFLTKHLNP